MNKEKAKRLSLDLAASDHKAIKMRSTEQNMTMKEWIIVAIRDRIQKEEELGWGSD